MDYSLRDSAVPISRPLFSCAMSVICSATARWNCWTCWVVTALPLQSRQRICTRPFRRRSGDFEVRHPQEEGFEESGDALEGEVRDHHHRQADLAAISSGMREKGDITITDRMRKKQHCMSGRFADSSAVVLDENTEPRCSLNRKKNVNHVFDVIYKRTSRRARSTSTPSSVSRPTSRLCLLHRLLHFPSHYSVRHFPSHCSDGTSGGGGGGGRAGDGDREALHVPERPRSATAGCAPSGRHASAGTTTPPCGSASTPSPRCAT